jgi:MFS transporter, DHA2 family, multidrug resistance protein
VVIEAIVAVLALYLFVVHIFTTKHAFIEPAIFSDRNFSIGLVFIFIIGVILLATMALLPPYLQALGGYPVIDVGLLLAPRGIGTMIAMLMVGRLSGKLDARLMIGVGLAFTCLSLWLMTRFTIDMSGRHVITSGILQGFGLGFIFVPLSTLTFSTLASHYRNEGTALFSLVRNIGSSIGISVVITYLSQRIQINHAAFAGFITPFQPAVRWATDHGSLDLSSTLGLSMIDAQVTAEAANLAYLQDFRLMLWITLAATPLIFLLRPPKKKTKAAEVPDEVIEVAID